MKIKQIPSFFLATHSPQGYVSRFNEFSLANRDYICYTLHGTPSSGKSDIIQSVANELLERGYAFEKIYSSQSPQTLDGLICHDLKFSIADASHPHIINPEYPQSVHRVISLYDCVSKDILYPLRHEIKDHTESVARCEKYCHRFLAASGQLMNDSYLLALEATDTQKIAALAKRIATREFKHAYRKNNQGMESSRFLSAVTKDGILMHESTAELLCDNLYLLEDEYGAASKLLLLSIRSYALEAGLKIYCCYCPLSPYSKLEHIFIPELKLGFVTTNKYHPLNINPYKVVNARRFTDLDEMKRRKKRIAFNKKSAFTLLDQTFLQLREAHEHSEVLRGIYRSGLNIDAVSQIKSQIFAEIFADE